MKAIVIVTFAVAFLVASLAATMKPDRDSLDGCRYLVAETVAWQLHWDQRMGLGDTKPLTVTLEMREASSEVLVNNFKWVLGYGYGGNQLYPISIVRLTDLPDEIRDRELVRFGNLAQITMKVPDYGSCFKKISSCKSDFRQKLVACFRREACDRKSLSDYEESADKPLKNIRFRLAPVDPNFPVIMFFVEGVPCIGKVYFDTHSIEPVYSEFLYIGDAPQWRKAKLKLMDAIRSEGDLFELKDGRLVARGL